MWQLSNLWLHNTCKVTITKPSWEEVEKVFRNITCDAGRASLARRMSGENSLELWVLKYIAIGTWTATPAVSDTILASEQYRSAIITDLTSVSTYILKVYARFYPGYSITATEAWVFCDADASPTNGSGVLMARSLFDSPVTKNTTDILTIEWTLNTVNAT